MSLLNTITSYNVSRPYLRYIACTCKGGTVVEISGTGFGTSPASSGAVTVDGMDATVMSYSDTAITAILPSVPPGLYDVVVFVHNKGSSVTRFVCFFFVQSELGRNSTNILKYNYVMRVQPKMISFSRP